MSLRYGPGQMGSCWAFISLGSWGDSELGLPELMGLRTHRAGGGQEGAGVWVKTHPLSSFSPARSTCLISYVALDNVWGLNFTF